MLAFKGGTSPAVTGSRELFCLLEIPTICLPPQKVSQIPLMQSFSEMVQSDIVTLCCLPQAENEPAWIGKGLASHIPISTRSSKTGRAVLQKENHVEFLHRLLAATFLSSELLLFNFPPAKSWLEGTGRITEGASGI